jgi:pimeloyl-ACP methyl ester carboxylesterase
MVSNVGPFRLSVQLADALAELGVTSLRLDQSGKGESPIRPDVAATDAALLDYDEALADLARSNIQRTVIIGICSGAVDALRIAARRDSVVGLVLLDGYVGKTLRWYWHRGRYALRWVRCAGFRGTLARLLSYIQFGATAKSDAALTGDLDWPVADLPGCYRDVLGRGVKMLCVFSGNYLPYNHAGQLSRFLSVSSDEANFREIFLKDADHIYSMKHHRDNLISTLRDWVGAEFVTGDTES